MEQSPLRAGSLLRLILFFLTLLVGVAPSLAAQPSLPGTAIPREGGEPPSIDRPIPPESLEGFAIWDEARRVPGERLIVSISDRRVWLMDDDEVVYTAPVAVGKSVVLEYEDEVWNFATPRGRRTVLSKEKNPVWVPPTWHYVELAVAQGWQLEELQRGRSHTLTDGSRVVVRGNAVGRLLPDGSFRPVPAGEEAVFEGTLFIPPFGTQNRRIPGELGAYKIDFGNAYYFHGTPYEDSIGTASTHGCIRLRHDDLEFLYNTVSIGTPVYLY